MKREPQKDRKKSTIAAVCILLLLGLGAGLIWLTQNDPLAPNMQASRASIEDAATRLSIRYSEPLKPQHLTAQDKKDKFIFRLTSTNPAMLVSVRYEDGLRTVSTLAKQEPLELLLSNAAKAYPERYPNYKLLSERKLTIDDRSAAELTFTYHGPSGEVIKQRQLIVTKDETTAYYVSVQSTESNFDNLNKLYFASLLASPRFKD